MEKSPFNNKPFDGLKPRNEFEVKDSKPSKRNNLIAKILGVGFTCMFLFFAYNLYLEFAGVKEEGTDKYITDDVDTAINGLNNDKKLPTKEISVDISNVSVDDNVKLKTSRIAPYTDVNFTITKPSGEVYKFTQTTKITGIVDVEIPSEKLTEVGDYKIEASSPGFTAKVGQKFRLREGNVSSEMSEIQSDKTNLDVGKEALITVTLRDQYKNPIKERVVELISTRPMEDEIRYVKEKETDLKGIVKFYVTSKQEGESSYLAMDKKGGVTVASKIDITYKGSLVEDVAPDNNDIVMPEGIVEESGAVSDTVSFLEQLFLIHKAYASSDASYFSIEGPAEYTAEKADTVVIKVYDATNSLATEFTGKVVITVPDGSISISPDYTFKAEDMGEKNLPVTFSKAGSYLMSVSLEGETSIKGEKQVLVSDAVSGTGDIKKPEILSPPKGSVDRETVLSSPEIDIAGKADPDTTIEVYDGESKIGEILSNNSGLFFFKTKPMTDGKHELKVKALDAQGNANESDVVSVILDTTNPLLIKSTLLINPSKVMPGDTVVLTLKAEPNLSSARAIIDKTAVSLIEDETQAGTYTGEYIAPDEPGTYRVDVELKDEVSNPVMYNNQGEIMVTFDPSINTGGDVPINNDQPETGPRELFILAFIGACLIGWKVFKTE